MGRFSGLRQRWFRKTLRFLAIALVSCGLLLTADLDSSAVAVTPRHYTELEFPPLPEIQIPDYERFELDNGMVVYLMEDHELPLVSGTVLFRSGDRWEPEDKVGLASVVGGVMRSGGTENHPSDELNLLLEQQAASVETSIGSTSGSASFSALSEDVDQVFDLFAEVLRQPAFEPDKVELFLNQYRGSIARRNDDPDDIASREFYKLVYGKDSPYARTAEYSTLENISRDDVLAFYEQYVQPNRMILGIVGDIDPAAMKTLVQEKFGDWQSTSDPLPDLPAVQQMQQGGVFFVDQPQLTQSSIRMGHLGGQFDNSDYAAMSVVNGVLNGFGGRLFNEVRSRQGLAYSVYAFWSARYDYPGVFIGGGQTRSDATVPFVESVMEEIERIRTAPVAADELQYAKDSVLNSFVFNFADPEQTLSRLMRYEYYGYPADFVFQYQQQVEATTVEDVLRAAQANLQPDQIVTLIVGNQADIQPPASMLSPSGDVTMIDVSIPEAQPS
jgi:zinc protease